MKIYNLFKYIKGTNKYEALATTYTPTIQQMQDYSFILEEDTVLKTEILYSSNSPTCITRPAPSQPLTGTSTNLTHAPSAPVLLGTCQNWHHAGHIGHVQDKDCVNWVPGNIHQLNGITIKYVNSMTVPTNNHINIWTPTPQTGTIAAIQCDCGAKTAKTTCASWCSTQPKP